MWFGFFGLPFFFLTGKKPPKYSSHIQEDIQSALFWLMHTGQGRISWLIKRGRRHLHASTQVVVTTVRGNQRPSVIIQPSHAHRLAGGEKVSGKATGDETIHVLGQFSRRQGSRPSIQHGAFFLHLEKSFPWVQGMFPPPFYHSSLQMSCQWNAHFNSESLIALLIFNFFPL